MARGDDRFAEYHAAFHGDTYDACRRCGGLCERYKISTLLPGEKEHIAATLGMSVSTLEDRYLDRLDTTRGMVDVLKMKDGCPFLTSTFRCRAIRAKPVLCDSYPIAFECRRSVRFFLDEEGCPMTRWPEYAAVVDRFRREGIPALRRLRVPASWWRTAALYDEFDFDYRRIERRLRCGPGYETFRLEDVLGFACRGHEVPARRRGLRLADHRLRQAADGVRRRVDGAARGAGGVRRLAAAYRARVDDDVRAAREMLRAAGRDPALLGDPAGGAYAAVLERVRGVERRLEVDGATYVRRLRDAAGLPPPVSRRRSDHLLRVVDGVDPAFRAPGTRRPAGLAACEVMGEDTPEARAGYALLARCFGPDEIVGPRAVRDMLADGRERGGAVVVVRRDGVERRLWWRWILLVAHDRDGRLVAAGDGAVLADARTTMFYASHIATRPGQRSCGIGSWLTAACLQAADDHLAEAERMLGCRLRFAPGASLVRLAHELAEVEFPDLSPSGQESCRRLPFHGRLQRAALWPLRYARPDMNYGSGPFDPRRWNSVPMFLCHRSFDARRPRVREALEAAELLYDFFAATMMREGVEWDRAQMRRGLARDGRVRRVPLPTRSADIPDLVRRTTSLAEALRRYYASHRYARERIGPGRGPSANRRGGASGGSR